MKEDKFEGLMKRYVASTARGKDSDLKKLTDEVAQAAAQEAARKNKLKRNAARLLAVAAIVAVLTLSIALPLALRKEYDGNGMPVGITQSEAEDPDVDLGVPPTHGGTEPDGGFYCSAEDVNVAYFTDNAEAVFAAEGLNVMLPVKGSLGSLYGVMTLKGNGTTVGASISEAVYDGVVDEVDIKALVGGYHWQGALAYEQYPDELQWRGHTVKYYVDRSGEQAFFTFLYFSDGNVRYYISISSLREYEIPYLLGHIF